MGLLVVVSTPGTTPGGFTISKNDALASLAGIAACTEANSASADILKEWFDKLGFAVEIGRGLTDTDITYIAMKNENGTLIYAYPNAAGTGWTVTPTKP